MKKDDRFYSKTRQMMQVAKKLQAKNMPAGKLMDSLVELEEELVAPFYIPASAYEVNEILQSYQWFGNASEQSINELYKQLKDFACNYLQSNAYTDTAILQDAKQLQKMPSEVFPYMGRYTTLFNNFLYQYLILYKQIPIKNVLKILYESETEGTALHKVINKKYFTKNIEKNIAHLHKIHFTYAEDFLLFYKHTCDMKNYLNLDDSYIELDTIYLGKENFDELEKLCYYKKNTINNIAKKQIILDALIEPVNMYFQELIQGRIIDFCNESYDKYAFIYLELKKWYGRGLYVKESIFELI